MGKRRIVFALHDAGGTVPPFLALAEELLRRGHWVEVLSQPSVRARAERIGCAFRPFTGLDDYDRSVALEEQLDRSVAALAGEAVGDDLLALASQVRPDAVVVDPNLAGCLAAAATLPCRTVVLLHSMYETYVETWFGHVWPLLAEVINETRAHFGLQAASSWWGLFDEHDLLLSIVPDRFDATAAGGAPAALLHVGFLVPELHGEHSGPWFPAGDGPTVLVGLSTTQQGQAGVLRTIVSALGGMRVRALVTTSGHLDEPLQLPDHVVVADHVPHPLALREAAVMVTHAGLGSVAAALHAGVPLVCLPMGRDQHLNAARVTALGAGVELDDPDASRIVSAIDEVLTDDRYRRAAAGIAAESRAAGGARRAADEIERLVR